MALGFICPPIVMLTFQRVSFSGLDFNVFLNRLLSTEYFAPVLSVCVVVNLLLFFGFIWLNKDSGSRGVLFSTIIYAFVILGLKLF